MERNQSENGKKSEREWEQIKKEKKENQRENGNK